MTALDQIRPAIEPASLDETVRRERAGWERPALIATLVATGVLYLWGLGASGWANSFYSAAVQAASVSWKAFLFGSLDAANAITVDKPPAALWVMALSVRIFGLSSWSILVPQALMGVGTVAAVWYGVRRWFSAGAALLASLVMALTPVAVLMFRFNNPDALLTLLLTLAAITTLRGIEDGRRRWAIATGVLVGLGFLTKQLQVMLIVPPLALAWIVAAKGSVRRRVVDLAIAGTAVVVSAGWWVALVELWPADSRPWVGGSQTNSVLELTFGYNGLGRITGEQVGSVTAALPAAVGGMWGETGITRMVDGVIGGQIAWLLPAALAAVVGCLWVTRRSVRTDVRRAAMIVWGGWLILTALVFSYMAGIFHEYYTVALAPPIAAMVGIGAHYLWLNRTRVAARVTAALVVVGSSLWSAVLLGRAVDWNAWLVPVLLVGGVLAGTALALWFHRTSRMALAALAAAAIVLLVGPAAWSLETAATPHSGSIVTAGPDVDAGVWGRPGNPGGLATPSLGDAAPGAWDGGSLDAADPTGGQAPAVPGRGAVPGMPPDDFDASRVGATPGAPPVAAPGQGAGGLLNGSEPSEALTALLVQDAADYTWVAATVGANNASGYQLATEQPVMALGGFNGSDPFPTLAEFQDLVAADEIHWFIGSGQFGGANGGSTNAVEIADWVTNTFEATQVDGVTLYELAAREAPS